MQINLHNDSVSDSNANDLRSIQDFDSLRDLPLDDIRKLIRAGSYSGHTAGLGPGYLQGNIIILPEEYALDFFRFCQRNSKACPLVGVSDTGDPTIPLLGMDIDIRTDVPMYNVYREGDLDQKVTDIQSLWRDDFVTFVIGCSFTFEDALTHEGIHLRHIEENLTVPMFYTNLDTEGAGPFKGRVVASMRPMKVRDAIRASAVTSRFPQAHGEPIHFGDPAAIGIGDVSTPDWGDEVSIKEGEVPVFWACGVTPQVALAEASPSICITHTPGCMLITDVRSGSVQPKIKSQD